MAKKRKNDQIPSIGDLIVESDTDPIVNKIKRHDAPPKKRRRWWVWILGTLAVLWVIGTLNPPKDRQEASAPSVASVPTTAPSITPIIRETITAEARFTQEAIETANAPTQTPIIEYVVITATSEGQSVAVVAGANVTPTSTDVPSITPTATHTPTATITATHTPVPTATQSGVREMTDRGVVSGESVNVRTCANTECLGIGRMTRGATFDITGSVADGQSIEGNRLWYQIVYEGQVGYVSATLVRLASAQPTASVPIVQPVAPVQPVTTSWNCVGDIYNCSDFGRGGQFTCQQLRDYWNTCPGDPSRLDGNNDRKPCESRCP